MTVWHDQPLPFPGAQRQPMGHPWGFGADRLVHLDRCPECGRKPSRWADRRWGLSFPDGPRCGPCARARWEAQEGES